jgi:L,D-peptidoglycan transpeptidase YkuD (ErfK/YbiS/YcfS/YnhG family)
VGPASEDTSFTPVGEYSLTFAFGINPDPGSAIGYTQVDDSDYWVDDPKSQYYNLFVSTNQVTPDWDSAEHLKQNQVAYAYAININYNMERIPRAGSAIFLHCSNGNPTAGCVAIPQKEMVFVLTYIGSSCGIVIDNANSIMNH